MEKLHMHIIICNILTSELIRMINDFINSEIGYDMQHVFNICDIAYSQCGKYYMSYFCFRITLHLFYDMVIFQL